MTQDRTGATRRGFAGMDINRQREIARKRGANVPREKRSFAQDRALASNAGRKGGRAVAPQARSFCANRDLASAGRRTRKTG
jgi:general stress protein YciG